MTTLAKWVTTTTTALRKRPGLLRVVVRRSAGVLAVTGVVLAGLVAGPAPSVWAGPPSGEDVCREGLAPAACLPVIEFDRGQNVEELWFEVAARSTVVFTVTMENAEGQGRHEHTAWVRNAGGGAAGDDLGRACLCP